MLTREVMGWLALAILWVNTLLTVAAAVGPLRQLAAWLTRAARLGVRTGVAHANDSKVLAWHAVEQVGRRAADDSRRRAILFHDRSFAWGLQGGVVELDGERLTLEAAAPHAPALSDASGPKGPALFDASGPKGPEVEVWVSRAEQSRIAEQACREGFEPAYRASCKAKGFVRCLRTELEDGARVWIVGEHTNEVLRAPADAPLLIATFAPRPWLRARVAMLVGFQLAMLLGSAAISWLVLTPPIFGAVSVAGAVLGLLFFLFVMQPGGVVVRDAARLPSRAFVRGSWVEPPRARHEAAADA